MANTKISQLTEFTGNPENSWMIINNSGETETFKILRESFLSGVTYVEKTYSELYELYNTSGLTPGFYYLITDFQTCYVQPGWVWVDSSLTPLGIDKQGPVERLVVLATSVSALSPQAYSLEFPLDKITYDIEYTETELFQPAKGRITERITENNNRADYDLRSVLFRRYDGYFSTSLYYYKNITIFSNGEVQGTNTLFTSDLTVGQIIGIKDFSENIGGITYYEITQIESDTQLFVTGNTIIENYNVSMVNANGFGDPISPYPTNIISNTASTEHLTFDNGLDGSYSNYLGDYANLYTLNGNTFLLSNNVFFGGAYVNNTFGSGFANNTFDDDIDGNRVGMRFENNIITNDFESNRIGDDFKNNWITCDMEHNLIGNFFTNNMIADDDGSDFDSNTIGNFFEYNFIPMMDDFNTNTIGDGFYNNIILNNITKTLIVSSFQDNLLYGGIDECAFYGSTSNNTFQSNVISSQFGDGFSDNTVDSEVNKTSVGSNFSNNIITGNTFNENRIGPNFINNVIINNFDTNEIGSDFDSNNIYGEFTRNRIGEDFYENDIYDTFQNNQILNEFNTNTIGDSENIGNNIFENNEIMDNFKGNNIQENFWNNRIKTDFKGNQIFDVFSYNNIGFGCVVNNFSGQTIHNTIGDYFGLNDCLGSFSYNTIGTNFFSNQVGDGFGFGGGSYRGNRIGNNFYDNNVGEYFYNNYIEDNFANNTVGYYFQLNDIKVNGLNSINFVTYLGNINTISYSPTSSSVDDTYSVVQTSTNLHGYGSEFSVVVAGGSVVDVITTSQGYEYQSGEEITISADQFNGLDDLIIYVDTISETPLVYSTANCTIQKTRDGFDVITTLDWDTVSWYISDVINGPYNP
jgi:hypothetical protein